MCLPVAPAWCAQDTITGETLCDGEKPVVLERMDFPDPVIKVAIEPKTKADVDKMANGLIKLAQEDPSFHFSRDDETNQTVIEGMGELHLEIIVDRLKREFKVGFATPLLGRLNPSARGLHSTWALNRSYTCGFGLYGFL